MRFTLSTATVLATVATIMAMTTSTDAYYTNDMKDSYNNRQPIGNLLNNGQGLSNLRYYSGGNWNSYAMSVGQGYRDMAAFLNAVQGQIAFRGDYNYVGIAKDDGNNGPYYTIVVGRK
ncbi:hypothetical protein BDF19DRAFT_438233 [Syncephalis fuscata]|nr:hypothetical protein BDF19DRAFT_438233 [Syncephalis fuscata]